jgi:DNA-binding protein H-NS
LTEQENSEIDGDVEMIDKLMHKLMQLRRRQSEQCEEFIQLRRKQVKEVKEMASTMGIEKTIKGETTFGSPPSRELTAFMQKKMSEATEVDSEGGGDTFASVSSSLQLDRL